MLGLWIIEKLRWQIGINMKWKWMSIWNNEISCYIFMWWAKHIRTGKKGKSEFICCSIAWCEWKAKTIYHIILFSFFCWLPCKVHVAYFMFTSNYDLCTLAHTPKQTNTHSTTDIQCKCVTKGKCRMFDYKEYRRHSKASFFSRHPGSFCSTSSTPLVFSPIHFSFVFYPFIVSYIHFIIYKTFHI